MSFGSRRRHTSIARYLPIALGLCVGSTSVLAIGSPPPKPPAAKDKKPPDAPQAKAPPAAPAATATPAGSPMAQGESQYQAEDFEGAAIQFYKISSGEIPGDTARAQFWLGKALYKLGFYSASLSVYDEIVTAGPSHPFHKLTLPWLASLSRELPEGAEVLQKIGTYKPTDLEDEAFDEVRDELYYLLGRFYYQKGDLAQGIALLDQVPKNSDYYVQGQFFLGVAHTRDGKGEPAVEAFKNVLRRTRDLQKAEEANKKKSKADAKKARRKARKSRKGKKKGRKRRDRTTTELTFLQEMQKYQDAARLGMANIFYMVGKFSTSIKYLDMIELDSRYYLDAIHWAAWAEFRQVEVDEEHENEHYQRTLGYVHTLNAPFFEDYLYPDALKLKAVTYYFNCRYDSAKFTADEFRRKYPKTMEDLRGILEQAPEDFQLYDLARKIVNEESDLDPFVEQVAQKALQDKTLAKYFGYVEELENESELYETMSGAFKSAGIGERVTEDLDLALSAARERTGAEARQRLTAQIKEIQDLNVEMIKVEYEILERRKAMKALESVPPKPVSSKVDEEHERYKYNGEYWQDELGYYRYEVSSICKE